MRLSQGNSIRPSPPPSPHNTELSWLWHKVDNLSNVRLSPHPVIWISGKQKKGNDSDGQGVQGSTLLPHPICKTAWIGASTVLWLEITLFPILVSDKRPLFREKVFFRGVISPSFFLTLSWDHKQRENSSDFQWVCRKFSRRYILNDLFFQA